MKLKIAGVKLNKRELDKAVGNSREFQKEAHRIAQRKMEEAKALMIQEFNLHPVTQELEMGGSASNISGTLGGYGNLFSFMGFSAGSKPTEEVRKFLKESIKLKTSSSKKTSKATKEFTINTPTLDSFRFASMPWESGNSWVKSVEKGMSSFSYFMHKAHEASRSGMGIQIDNNIRNKSSAPTKYMSEILEKFRKRLSK
tara:strand:+ start:1030 stop:1626 length:597 start_codon:yes stop_codon:yes gene_type:complete